MYLHRIWSHVWSLKQFNNRILRDVATWKQRQNCPILSGVILFDEVIVLLVGAEVGVLEKLEANQAEICEKGTFFDFFLLSFKCTMLLNVWFHGTVNKMILCQGSKLHFTFDTYSRYWNPNIHFSFTDIVIIALAERYFVNSMIPMEFSSWVTRVLLCNSVGRISVLTSLFLEFQLTVEPRSDGTLKIKQKRSLST